MIPLSSLCTIHDDDTAGLVAYRYHGEHAFVRLYDTNAAPYESNSRHAALRVLSAHMCRKEAAPIRGVLGCFPQELWADLTHAAVETGKCLQHLMFNGLNGPSFSAGVLCGVEELVAQRRVNKDRHSYLTEHGYASERLRAALTSCAIMALAGAKGDAERCVNAAMGLPVTDDEELEFRKSDVCVTAVMDSFVILSCGYFAVMS